MNRQRTPMTDAQLDSLLHNHDHNLTAPTNFSTQVIQAIEAQTEISAETHKDNRTSTTWWQWLALLAGMPAITQVFALIFSVWHITSAG